MRSARAAARKLYPDGWASRLDHATRTAAAVERDDLPPSMRGYKWPQLVVEEYKKFAAKYAGALWADMSDSEIIEVAAECARDVGAAIAARLVVEDLPDTPDTWADWLNALCKARNAEFPKVPKAVIDAGPVAVMASVRKRIECRIWWRRQLRRYVARMSEGGALELGIVSKRSKQPYASNRAVLRRRDQNARNAAMLGNTHLANEAGDVFTLAELVAKSPAAKHIRRGELMTRIRGCEEVADAAGHVGLFLTLTCPSMFHSITRAGRKNPKYAGGSPRDAQAWLCAMWARSRAMLARMGVKVYGFRVAEPHHDGCPHWHALVWTATARDAMLLTSTLWAYWLSDDGDEPGAADYRLSIKAMKSGGAAGYIAKYIAKNIDDHAIDSHLDDYAPGKVINADVLGDAPIKPCDRVEAWAAHWGVRQFQALGQPPVTVWRELRRVEAATVAEHPSQALRAAWSCAHRRGAELADWAGYVRAQGGMGQGRKYALHLALRVSELEGAYETMDAARPVGVEDKRKFPGLWCVSKRRTWRVVSRSEAVCLRREATASRARTSLNNCTPGDRAASGSGGAWAGLLVPRGTDGDDTDAARWWRGVHEARAVKNVGPVVPVPRQAVAVFNEALQGRAAEHAARRDAALREAGALLRNEINVAKLLQ